MHEALTTTAIPQNLLASEQCQAPGLSAGGVELVCAVFGAKSGSKCSIMNPVQWCKQRKELKWYHRSIFLLLMLPPLLQLACHKQMPQSMECLLPGMLLRPPDPCYELRFWP